MEPTQDMIEIECTGQETWITFNGKALLDEVCINDLKKQLLDIADKKQGLDMLLNFAEVEFMSSSFLGLLIGLEKSLGETGGTLTLCNIRPQILKVFKLTKLDKVFNIN